VLSICWRHGHGAWFRTFMVESGWGGTMTVRHGSVDVDALDYDWIFDRRSSSSVQLEVVMANLRCLRDMVCYKTGQYSSSTSISSLIPLRSRRTCHDNSRNTQASLLASKASSSSSLVQHRQLSRQQCRPHMGHHLQECLPAFLWPHS